MIPAIVCHSETSVAAPTANVHHYNAVVGYRQGQPAPPFPAHLTRDDVAAIFYTSVSVVELLWLLVESMLDPRVGGSFCWKV